MYFYRIFLLLERKMRHDMALLRRLSCLFQNVPLEGMYNCVSPCQLDHARDQVLWPLSP